PGDQSATARLWFSPLPILFGDPAKKNGLKRFCASSISLSGFHGITLFNVFIYFTFLDSVKAILVHRANRLLSESTLILCTLRDAELATIVRHPVEEDVYLYHILTPPENARRLFLVYIDRI